MARTRKHYTKKHRKRLKSKKRNPRTKKRGGHITPVPNRNGNENENRDVSDLSELEARLRAHSQEHRESVNQNAPPQHNSNRPLESIPDNNLQTLPKPKIDISFGKDVKDIY